MVTKTVTLAEKLFFAMVWIILLLIATVFVLQFVQNNGGSFLGGVAGWAQSHAGLQ